ncbi:hypothetical protein ACLK10_22080 [Escherichia coli]
MAEDGKQSELEAMCRDRPFFSTRLWHAGDGLRQSRPVAGRNTISQRLVETKHCGR